MDESFLIRDCIYSSGLTVPREGNKVSISPAGFPWSGSFLDTQQTNKPHSIIIATNIRFIEMVLILI
jgi:hypothetical protein